MNSYNDLVEYVEELVFNELDVNTIREMFFAKFETTDEDLFKKILLKLAF